VTIETLETPSGKKLQNFPVGSDGGVGLLGSGGFAFFQLFGELLGDAFRWDAESFGGDWLPDWLGELRVKLEAYDGLPGRCDGAFIEEFVGFDGGAGFGDGFLKQLDVAVPDFCVVRLVGVEVELFFGADWCVNVDVLPFSVRSEGVEKLACA
jgi:hypothetical protein